MTTVIRTTYDINEIFENLLLAEEIAEQSGYEEGYNAGKNQSLKGYHLGYHRGSELAAKLGYYSGIAEHCLKSSIHLPKVIEQAKKLLEAIQQFPTSNDETVDIIKNSEEIKFKFIKDTVALAMKTFEEDLKDNLSFIEEHEKIINSHLVDFITGNLWEKLPKDLRIELEQFQNKSNFSDLMSRCPTLQSIIEETNSLNLKNNPKVLKLEDLPLNLSRNTLNWEKNHSLKEPQNDFMKDKKRYEISVLSNVIESLAADNKSLVIDAGGGKGYLGTYLSGKYSVPVLSIDSNPGRNTSAINRQKLMEKKKNQSFPLTRHSTEFIDENTNFSKLVKFHFPNWSGNDYLLTGLHSCGPLAHAMIKSFINSDALKSLCVISCCYHLTDEFLTTRINFTKTMRMLAQQSVERISAKNCEHPASIFYRALLQVLLQTLGIPDERVGRGAPTEDFQTYAKWALAKVRFPPHERPSNNDLTNLQKKYSEYQWKLNVFQTLRAHMGAVIESSIILDRFVYLQKSKKCSKLSIVRLFDPLLSPRCYAIIASK